MPLAGPCSDFFTSRRGAVKFESARVVCKTTLVGVKQLAGSTPDSLDGGKRTGAGPFLPLLVIKGVTLARVKLMQKPEGSQVWSTLARKE